jgi:hypothetical protein
MRTIDFPPLVDVMPTYFSIFETTIRETPDGDRQQRHRRVLGWSDAGVPSGSPAGLQARVSYVPRH